MKNYPIKEEWKNYYDFLEDLRQSGETNMWGAGEYLEDAYDLSPDEARDILINWITNYDELNGKYGWR